LWLHIATMPRKVEAIKNKKLKIEEDVQEIFEKTIVPHGNGAKIMAQKKDIGKRAYIIIIKD